MYKRQDFITLHVPKVDDKAIIGAEEIGLMKKGAGIINTSRGGNIDETALMFALDKEKLAYAGLDVFEVYELLKKSDIIMILAPDTSQKKIYEDCKILSYLHLCLFWSYE